MGIEPEKDPKTKGLVLLCLCFENGKTLSYIFSENRIYVEGSQEKICYNHEKKIAAFKALLYLKAVTQLLMMEGDGFDGLGFEKAQESQRTQQFHAIDVLPSIEYAADILDPLALSPKEDLNSLLDTMEEFYKKRFELPRNLDFF